MEPRTSILGGLSTLVGGVASLSATGFAQQLPAPGQLEQEPPPLPPPPTPEQAAQADRRQGNARVRHLGEGGEQKSKRHRTTP